MTFGKNIRIILGLVFVVIFLAAAISGLRQQIPKYLAEHQLATPTDGKVAGASAQSLSLQASRESLQQQVDQIKAQLLNLKPDDLKNNQSIERILNDLQSLREEVSQSAKVTDVKSNICEEAKKRFCE